MTVQFIQEAHEGKWNKTNKQKYYKS